MTPIRSAAGSICLCIVLIVLPACSAKVTTQTTPLVNLQSNLAAVDAYYTNGQYEADVLALVEEADNYLDEELKKGTHAQPSIIFDIDDTLLSNVMAYRQMGYRFQRNTWDQWVNRGQVPAIAPMRDLFMKYADRVDIFIITGRNVLQRAQTLRNLKGQGYTGWAGIFFKEAWDRELTAQEFKSRIIRQLIDVEGMEIIANFGDQESDFGTDIQGREFRLPNYLYITK